MATMGGGVHTCQSPLTFRASDTTVVRAPEPVVRVMHP